MNWYWCRREQKTSQWPTTCFYVFLFFFLQSIKQFRENFILTPDHTGIHSNHAKTPHHLKMPIKHLNYHGTHQCFPYCQSLSQNKRKTLTCTGFFSLGSNMPICGAFWALFSQLGIEGNFDPKFQSKPWLPQLPFCKAQELSSIPHGHLNP